MKPGADAATINIVTNALRAVADEMGVNLLRSARSTIIREARDCSCALLDDRGRLVAQADHAPIQMSSLALPLQAILAKHDPATYTQDDIFLTNDPYNGGQHLQDLIVFLPIFSADTLVGFAGSVAHHIDIGGGSAGLTLDAAEIFGEGLRFPLLRLPRTALGDDGVIAELVRGNFREPGTSMGDLRAQLAACTVGRDRFQELALRYGREVLRECVEAGLDAAERLMRNAIGEIPDGEYLAEDVVDSGVVSADPIRVRLKLTVAGDQMHLDFAGTDPQTEDFLNVPFASTVSAVYSAVSMFAASRGRRLPPNSGSHRPIHLSVPLGCFLNPTSPAAVRARMCGAYRVFDTILMALQKALPGQVPALGYNVNTTVGFSQRRADRFRIFIEDIGGGWGATPTHDGQDMLDAPLSNCKITPVEVLELDHRYLRMRRYEYVPDSGGAGQFRGGLGSVREYEVLDDGVAFFAYGDRHANAPAGVLGGGPGSLGSFSLQQAEATVHLHSKTAVQVARGDVIRVVVGGGGGYGDPHRRSRTQARIDAEGGKVTRVTEGGEDAE